ncbi:MAG: hypothetical protein JWO38_1668, partial [Gemmataceae bacterium]|nr:hypothetical protein [Gemmataceae bacterium]
CSATGGRGRAVSGTTTLRQQYVSVWRELLCGWLGWPDDRFAAFVARYDADLDDRGNPLFYHYDELYFVLPQIIPADLAERLSRERSATSYSALGELIGELDWAITGRPFSPEWDTPAFDWRAARERVSAVLRRHGTSLGP